MDEILVSPYNFVRAIKRKVTIPQKIIVHDTTLRDGEQMPGVSFTINQKIALARKLDELGIHLIEAGFPAVSKNEKKAVKRIAKEGLNADILALARASKLDINAAIDCDIDMVLLFIATSDIHLKYKLKMTKSEVLEKIVTSVEYAKSHGIKTSFSSEDSTRTSWAFLKKLSIEAQNSGADRIGITDTTGCISPHGIRFLVRKMKSFIKKPLSIHLHNDFGLALANALAGVEAGADIVSTTVTGIGERAGNVPLEQFVIALKILYNKDVDINTTGFKELAELVSSYSKIKIPLNKPWVGDNVFTHESGIHVTAVLNNPLTYECVYPEFVGNKRHLVLGKHSGTGIIRNRLAEKGMKATKNQLDSILNEVKRLGEQKGRVKDKEFWEIVTKYIQI